MIGGTAWYGFREFSIENYFSTAAALGLTSVEIPLYWQVVEDPALRCETNRQLAECASLSKTTV